MKILKLTLRVFAFVSVIFLIFNCSVIRERGSAPAEYRSDFSSGEISLIMDADTITPMRVLKTDNRLDSIILRGISNHITPQSNDPFLRTLISRMYHTVTDSASLGVGIAAPQVGILKSIILVQRVDKEGSPFEVYINPKIVKYSALKQNYKEGCLSIPKERGDTQSRSYAVLIEYVTIDNVIKTEMIEGFTAVIFQHEIDHLNGILFTDRIPK